MNPEAGARRDIEVIHAVREAIGPDAKILTDGNFGYRDRLDLLEMFIRETQSADVFWLEEMVPPSVEDYRSDQRTSRRRLVRRHCWCAVK